MLIDNIHVNLTVVPTYEPVAITISLRTSKHHLPDHEGSLVPLEKPTDKLRSIKPGVNGFLRAPP